MIDLDIQALEDGMVARLQQAVTAGQLASALAVGDEDAARSTGQKLPGAAVFQNDDEFDQPKTWDPLLSEGWLGWRVFAIGEGLRTPLGGRRGVRGAYLAKRVIVSWLHGWELIPGCKLYYRGSSLQELDGPRGKAIYDCRFQHAAVLQQDTITTP